MYIKHLELLNFQVIKEFSADFNGSVYFITGDNELGKSTLLKAIGALLTGNRDDVLRNGVLLPLRFFGRVNPPSRMTAGLELTSDPIANRTGDLLP